MEQLKPCPFCGKEPLCHYDGTAWHVRCNNDDCAMQPHVALWEKCHVVEAWNTRAPDEQVRKLREALSEIVTITDRKHDVWDRAHQVLEDTK